MAHPEPITSVAVLEQQLDVWSRRPWLALDTEFIREDSYHAVLCLVQVGDGESAACIDTLAVPPAALGGLWRLLDDPAIGKVFHAPSQDLEIFARWMSGPVQPLFDTQIAAALLGYGDQLGYAALVERMTGVVLDKSLTRTDWSRRPLTGPELAYAAADVEHLAAIHGRLREQLRARGRLGWLEEDCARLADPARYANPPEDAWRRLKGIARLTPAAQAIARQLAAWRESLAQSRDRPRRWILEDDALYRIAERAPRTVADLEALHALPPKMLERHAEALVESVQAAQDAPPEPLVAELPFEDAEKAQLRRLQQIVREIAEREALPPSMIAPRADLERLVREGGRAVATVLTGWRRALAGEALLAALAA